MTKNNWGLFMKKLVLLYFGLLLLLGNFCVVAPNSCVADENKFMSFDFSKRMWGDFKELPTKPLHWDKTQWLIAGGFVGGTAAAFLVDGNIRTYYKTHKYAFLKSVSDTTTHFGDYKYQAPLILGLWSGAIVTGDSTLHKMVSDGAEASFFAAGLINPLIVYLSGRALPNANEEAMKFRPFVPGRFSFASGHTAEAFAMATVIDQDLRKHFGYWQTPVLYAIALGTAHSRIYDFKHYLSDVILGSGIGWSVGYWISNKPRNSERRNVFLVPSDDGVRLVYTF